MKQLTIDDVIELAVANSVGETWRLDADRRIRLPCGRCLLHAAAKIKTRANPTRESVHALVALGAFNSDLNLIIEAADYADSFDSGARKLRAKLFQILDLSPPITTA